MIEPIIASLTDPDAGMAEHLMQAQLLINERDAWKKATKAAVKELCKTFRIVDPSRFYNEEDIVQAFYNSSTCKSA